jgi:hypothetical protein
MAISPTRRSRLRRIRPLRRQDRAELVFDVIRLHPDEYGDVLRRDAPGSDLGTYPAGDLPDFGLTVFEIPYRGNLAVHLTVDI